MIIKKKKTFQIVDTEGTYLTIIKAIYKKLTENIFLIEDIFSKVRNKT